MKIENEIFRFNPNSQFELLQITDLQKQYLADLRGQNSVKMLVERYLANGWLVNFQLLYLLVELLVAKGLILNTNVNDYFKLLHVQRMRSNVVSAPKKNNVSYSVEKLLQLPFFRSIQPELAQYLLTHGEVFQYAAESVICETGEASRDLYVLLKGEAAVYTQTSTFKQFISILSESSVFGEMGFLLGEKRIADVIALKSSEVMVIPYQAEVLDRYLNKERAQNLQQRFWVQHALLHSEFFKNTPSDSLDELTFSGKIIDLHDQQILFNQGDVGNTAYVVIQGSLVVYENGQKTNTLPQGAFLGEISLMLNDGHRTATLIAQRNTKLLEIQRGEFYHLLAKNLYLAKEFQILAAQRLQRSSARAQS